MPKPSVTPFTWYTIRIDYDDDTHSRKTELVDWLKTQVGYEWVLFDEISDIVGKRHVQGKIGIAISNEQLRKNLKKQFVYLSGANYSCSHIRTTPEQYDSYIAKDGVLVSQFTSTPFTQSYIKDASLKHLELKHQYSQNNTKIKKRSDFTFTVASKFMEMFPAQVNIIREYSFIYKRSTVEQELYDKACKALLNYLLMRLGDIVKVFDDSILQRMYNGIKNSLINYDVGACEKRVEYYANKMEL